jgi:hypothetical protein
MPPREKAQKMWSEHRLPFIETFKLSSVNPHAWLTDVLTKLINRWPAARIDELLPWASAAVTL